MSDVIFKLRQFFANASHKRTLTLVVILLIIAAVPLTVFISQKQQEIRQRAAETVGVEPNFYGHPVNLLKLFGQKSIGETSLNKTSANQIYHASGVIVDKSSNPNKIYIVDSGNNRILGFNGIGYCRNDKTKPCTIDSDCNNGTSCVVDGSKGADLVFGQPDFESTACNGDSNIGIYKNPGSNTLCFMGQPYPTNTMETWTRTNIDVDNQGNLYVPDRWNNRILKFEKPFSQDRMDGKGDSIADFVWGQDDFTSNGINRQNSPIFETSFRATDSRSIWISFGFNTSDHVSARGVSVDSAGNIWVADTFNNRVLRFPEKSKEADLVLGQAGLNSTDFNPTRCVPNGPLNKMCTPTLAKINPKTGELYVLDEYPAPFKARILVFRPPFTNSMSAYKKIEVKEGPSLEGSSYFFQATGFTFNPYKEGEYANGVLWVNEHQAMRTILIDNDGNIIKVIGARDKNQKGGDIQYGGNCGSIYDGFNLWWPGGSIGIDNGNNIYLADERFHRISRYALPYNLRVVNGTTCLPDPNGGLFPGTIPNERSNDTMGQSTGATVYNNQLIVNDSYALKIWNDYLNKPIGSPSDIVLIGGMPSRIMFGDAIDDLNRLWMFNEHRQLKVYQLPFTGNDRPLADSIPLYWKDAGEQIQNINFFETGLTFDKINKALYIADKYNHRILRIKNYSEFNNRLYVDMVIGQPDKTTVKCNHNQEMPWLAAGPPTADSLCNPSSIKFDKLGNLYVVENGYECHGNNRITVFMADDLRSVPSNVLFPNIEARKVFNAPNLTTQALWGNCSPNVKDKPGTPISIAFNSANQMIIGNDGYYADAKDRHLRQLWFYADPLNKQLPDAYLELPMGAPGEITIDNSNNIIIQDHTWSRVWVINPGLDPFWLVSLPGANPIIYLTGTPTPTPTIPYCVNLTFGNLSERPLNIKTKTLEAGTTTQISADIKNDDGNRNNSSWNDGTGNNNNFGNNGWDSISWTAPSPDNYTIKYNIAGVHNPVCEVIAFVTARDTCNPRCTSPLMCYNGHCQCVVNPTLICPANQWMCGDVNWSCGGASYQFNCGSCESGKNCNSSHLCVGTVFTPTPTPLTFTPTPRATFTPISTNTPTPKPTRTPTLTLTFTPTPTANLVHKEDINRDGIINILDFNLWLKAYTNIDTSPYRLSDGQPYYPHILGSNPNDNATHPTLLDFNMWYRTFVGVQ